MRARACPSKNSAARSSRIFLLAFPPPFSLLLAPRTYRLGGIAVRSARLDLFRHPECICQVGPVSRRYLFGGSSAHLFADDVVVQDASRELATTVTRRRTDSRSLAELTRGQTETLIKTVRRLCISRVYYSRPEG